MLTNNCAHQNQGSIELVNSGATYRPGIVGTYIGQAAIEPS